MVCACHCAGEASGVRFAAMDQEQSAACSHRQRCAGRHLDRLHSASSQPQRGNHHAHLVPGRRVDEDAQDDHPASHHIKPYLRYSS